MAQYKVPQDVEAEDKLIGPFSFRQFIYLLIAGGAVIIAVLLFQIFPLLAIIPAPIIIFFIVLALPIRKEQPMETYLAALISFYLKPRKRFWVPGQRESTIKITAPKIIEEPRMKNISSQEAGHRLSFLAELVDTGGQSIKNTPMREDLAEEADSIVDMFDTGNAASLGQKIDQKQNQYHQAVVEQMKTAIQENDKLNPATIATPTITKYQQEDIQQENSKDQYEDLIVKPVFPDKQDNVKSEKIKQTEEILETAEKNKQKLAKPSIINLAHNKDFTVETIQKEANRVNNKEEVYISLH